MGSRCSQPRNLALCCRRSLDGADAARTNLLRAPVITISAAKNPIPLPTKNTAWLRSIFRNRL